MNKEVTCWVDQFVAWLEANSLTYPIEDPATFEEKLYEWATTDTLGKNAKEAFYVGFVDGKIKYTKVKATSKGDPLDPYDKKYPFYEAWENYLAAYRENAPESMRSITQTAGSLWAFMPSEKAFLSSAFQGMGIATVFAFFILILATGNIIQAIISLFCVASIIISVLAIMQFKGWEIGISESIAMVILIGFSVDYCVHLSSDYMHSAHSKRHDKMKQAYSEMGVSILSGAITTFGSGIFLFGGEMIFF